MNLEMRSKLAVLTAMTVTWMFLQPETAAAQSHVVPLSEVQQQVQSAAQTRATHLADIDRVFSLPAARDALKNANITPAQVRLAASSLSDQELSVLAMKSRAVERDVEGGFIVGLLALIGLIVVVLIVVAVVKS